MPLNPKSCHTIYTAVSYVFAPAPSLDSERFLQFQSTLAKHGLSFDQAQRADNAWNLTRAKPPLAVQARLPGPPIGQVLVASEWLEGNLDSFGDEAATVCDAIFEVWPGEKQVVTRDATIRQLYDVQGAPAFEFLWRQRLGQEMSQLTFLGKQVSGGGLRLVMPPDLTDPEPVQTEVRIESFFQDPRKLFVQVTKGWPQPAQGQNRFVPSELVGKVADFLKDDLLDFLMLTGGQR